MDTTRSTEARLIDRGDLGERCSSDGATQHTLGPHGDPHHQHTNIYIFISIPKNGPRLVSPQIAQRTRMRRRRRRRLAIPLRYIVIGQ